MMLKTCVRYGRISMEEGDLEFIYPQWIIPDVIIHDLNNKYRSIHHVQLCVISDEEGNFRVQELITRTERALNVWNKVQKIVEKKLLAKCKGYCEIEDRQNVQKELVHLTVFSVAGWSLVGSESPEIAGPSGKQLDFLVDLSFN